MRKANEIHRQKNGREREIGNCYVHCHWWHGVVNTSVRRGDGSSMMFVVVPKIERKDQNCSYKCFYTHTWNVYGKFCILSRYELKYQKKLTESSTVASSSWLFFSNVLTYISFYCLLQHIVLPFDVYYIMWVQPLEHWTDKAASLLLNEIDRDR